MSTYNTKYPKSTSVKTVIFKNTSFAMHSREISVQSDALTVSGLYNVDNVNTRTTIEFLTGCDDLKLCTFRSVKSFITSDGD